jgi:hypothetical protein
MRAPARLSDSDLLNWIKQMTERGRGYDYVQQRAYFFRRAVMEAGLEEAFPLISLISPKRQFGIPVASMPEPLCSEVRMLLKWKQDPFVPGRPRRARLRAVSAEVLE